MRAYAVVCILGVFASTCAAEEAVCNAGESCDEGDRTALLQGSVTVGNDDTEVANVAEETQAAMLETLKDLKEELDEADRNGWPDLNGIFKKVKAAVGGAGDLEKDFEGVVAAAKAFLEAVKADVKHLVADVHPSMSEKEISTKVQHFYEQVHKAAKKLWDSIKKLEDAWTNGVGKVAPKAINDGMKSMLKKVADEAKVFSDSFKHIAAELHKEKDAAQKALCASVKHNLHTVIKKASEFAKRAAALKHPPKEIEEALKILPSAIKDEVDKVLKKAEHSADHILDKITKGMKDVTHGVAKAFDGHCEGLPHSGSAQMGAGAIVMLVLGMFSLSL